MPNRTSLCCTGVVSLLALAVYVGVFHAPSANSPLDLPTATAQDLKPLEKPPAGQTYVGEKVCSSCHFEQNLAWRKSKHSKGFEILPAKYRADKSCLKCHATGFGEETGFQSVEATPALVGTSCEACHGPGSKHTEMGKQFTGKELTDAQKKYVASSTHKFLPQNICATCHLAQAHKKHPAYDKE
jgi:hypothetical protein